MKTRVLSTAMFSLLMVAASHAQTWQDNPVARQLEVVGSGNLTVFSGLKMLSLALLMTAGVLWLFYFRSAWHHIQERDTKRLMVQMPRRNHAPYLHLSGNSNGMRVAMHDSGSSRVRAPHLQAARYDKGRRGHPQV